MRIHMQADQLGPYDPPRVGNVYPVKGGRGLKNGHLQILLAITDPREYVGASGLLLVITKDGKPVGVNSYGMHYIEDLCPVAFCEGIEDLDLTIRSI
jgi:hypothetical protein